MSQKDSLVPFSEERMSLAEITRYADIFVKSGLFSDTKDAAVAAVKIQAGQEIGIQPFAAMANILIISGRIVFSANLIASKVKMSGKYDYEVVESNDDRCVLQFFSLSSGTKTPTGPPVVFDKQKASQAGLLNKQNWRLYPAAMLFARALTAGVRMHCPEVMFGLPVYTAEEMGADDVDENGDAIFSNEARKAAEKKPPKAEPEPEPEVITSDFAPVQEQQASAEASSRKVELPEVDTNAIDVVVPQPATTEQATEVERVVAAISDPTDPFADEMPVEDWMPKTVDECKQIMLKYTSDLQATRPGVLVRHIVNENVPELASVRVANMTLDQWLLVISKLGREALAKYL